MLGTPLYPEREIWVAASHMTGTTGSEVDASAFADHRGSFLVIAPPGLAAPVTVTFETADPDPAQNYCAALAPWSPMEQGGMCEDKTPLSITIDPTDPTKGYDAVKGQICRVPMQCRSQFVRAIASAATPGLVVLVIGKPSRLFSI